jgi:hypothetical protein
VAWTVTSAGSAYWFEGGKVGAGRYDSYSMPPIAWPASGALQWPMPGEAADKADPVLCRPDSQANKGSTVLDG